MRVSDCVRCPTSSDVIEDDSVPVLFVENRFPRVRKLLTRQDRFLNFQKPLEVYAVRETDEKRRGAQDASLDGLPLVCLRGGQSLGL
jgi:hypothetical protein